MTVYLDVIWMLNLLFDCLLLSLASLILKRRAPAWRLAAGGFLGSLIVLLHFTPYAMYAAHPLSKLLFSMFMVLAAFGYRRFSFFLSALFALYLSTFMVGGALTAAHYFFQGSGAVNAMLAAAAEGYGDPVSWLFVMIGFPVAWLFSRGRIEGIGMAKIKFDQLVSVQIEINGEIFYFTGLVDSGNQLHDPFTRNPVIFVSVKKCLDDLPEGAALIASEQDAVMQGEKVLPAGWESRLRVVPCSVVGQEHQMVLAFKPDAVAVIQGDKIFRTDKVLVSLTLQNLSSEGQFDCIVHPKLLAGIPADYTGAAS